MRMILGVLLFKLLDVLTRRRAAEQRALARRKAELLEEMDRAKVPWPPAARSLCHGSHVVEEHSPTCSGCLQAPNREHWHNGKGHRMPWSLERVR